MPTTIVFTCDNAEDALDVIATVLCANGDHRARLVALGDYTESEPDFSDEPTSDTYVEADPTPPHGIYLPITDLINAVDCPHPGCPGRRGQWCGSPITKATYGPYFTHKARK